MKKLAVIIISLSLVIICGCGKSEIEKGQEAYAKKDYLEAIKMLSLANELDKENFDQQELLAMAYLYRGEELYAQRKNVKAFAGNVEKAQGWLPEVISDSVKTEYCRLLVELGKAYQIAKPKSDVEKKAYFNSALENFKTALDVDSTYSDAIAALEQLREENFQKLLDKAQSLYDKGVRTRTSIHYFSALGYVEQAARFDDKNENLRTLLSKIRQRTLGILDPQDGLAMAVTKTLYKDKYFTALVAVENYTNRSIRIKRSQFELIDIRGNVYKVDEEELEGRKLFGDVCIEDTVLTSRNNYMDGILVFPVPEETYMKQLVYKISESEIKRKYFR